MQVSRWACWYRRNSAIRSRCCEVTTTPYERMKLTGKLHLGRLRSQNESISTASQSDKVIKYSAKAVLLTPGHNPACKTMINLNWVLRISKNLGRLFCKAEKVRSPLHNKILPIHSENLYLAINQTYWNIDTLSLFLMNKQVNQESVRKCIYIVNTLRETYDSSKKKQSIKKVAKTLKLQIASFVEWDDHYKHENYLNCLWPWI